MKKVLITGINGYIGKKLATALLAAGYTVFGIDRGEKPFREEIAYEKADITDKQAVDAFFAMHEIDAVIHLAALVHKSGEDLSKEAYHKINCEASEYIFHAAARAGVATILFSSTIEVYGEQDKQVIDEDTPCYPESFYAVSKYEAEKALLGMKDKFQRYAIMRFAPVYAEDFRLNLDKRFYIGNTRMAVYFKGGQYSFHFCEVQNIICFVLWFLERNAASGIYNISDEKPIVSKEFLEAEKQSGRVKLLLHPPYWLAYAGIAVLEGISRVISRNEPFFSRYNFRKLFRSTFYIPSTLREVKFETKSD